MFRRAGGGRKCSADRAQGELGREERKEHGCRRDAYSAYCLLVKQLTAVGGTQRNNFYECALAGCCW